MIKWSPRSTRVHTMWPEETSYLLSPNNSAVSLQYGGRMRSREVIDHVFSLRLKRTTCKWRGCSMSSGERWSLWNVKPVKTRAVELNRCWRALAGCSTKSVKAGCPHIPSALYPWYLGLNTKYILQGLVKLGLHNTIKCIIISGVWHLMGNIS